MCPSGSPAPGRAPWAARVKLPACQRSPAPSAPSTARTPAASSPRSRADRVVKVRGDPEHPYSQGIALPQDERVRPDASTRRIDSRTRWCAPGPKGAGRVPAGQLGRGHRARDRRAGRRSSPPTGPRRSCPTRTPARWASCSGTRACPSSTAWAPPASTAPSAPRRRTRAGRRCMGRTPGPEPGGGARERPGGALGHQRGRHQPPLRAAGQGGAPARAGGSCSSTPTPTTRAAVADEVILVRPGSDGALALALMHVLARDGLADEGFLAREAEGWPELRARALAEYAPAAVSARVGLPPEAIEELARTLARARAPFIRIGRRPLPLRQRRHDRPLHRRPGGGPGGVRPARAAAACSPPAPARPSTSPRCCARTCSPRPTRRVNMNELGRALTELRRPAGPRPCTSGAPTRPRWRPTRTRCCAGSPARTSSWWCTSGS